MPTVPKYLSRESLDISGGPSLLSAPRPISGQGAQVSTAGAQINTRAGMLQPRQVRPPELTTVQYKDVVGPAIENTGYALAKAGVAYAIRKDDLEANEGNLIYQQKKRDLWLGYEDPQTGDFVQGYAASKGKQASEGYAKFEAELNQLRQQIFGNMSNQDAGARFLAKSTAGHTAVLDQAAQHAATGTRNWEAQQLAADDDQFLIELNDSAHDPLKMGTMIQDHVQKRVQNNDITIDKVGGYTQGLYTKIGKYLASQPSGASGRLGVFMQSFGDQFDIDTRTEMNKMMNTVTDREMRYLQQQEYLREKADEKREKAYDNDLRERVERGNVIDWNLEMEKITLGTGGSWSAYYALKDRHDNGDRYPAMDPSAERIFKQELQSGAKDGEDIDSLSIDNASKRRLGSFYLSITTDTNAKQNQLYLPRIESIIKSATAKGADQDIKILNAQTSYLEKSASMDPDAAFNETVRPYVNAATGTEQLPPVSYGGMSYRPHGRDQVKTIYNDIKKKKADGVLSSAEAERAFAELRLFDMTFQSLEASKPTGAK